MLTNTANTAPTRTLETATATIAYRRIGRDDAPPLVLLQRFRGTMDEWDPLLLDALASQRELVIFDNAGVSLSTGDAPHTIAGMAERAVDVLDALGLDAVDLLGWSMGGAIAQHVALAQPDRVRRLVLAATGPGGAPGAPTMPQHVRDLMQKPVNDAADFLDLFFHASPTSRAAGEAHLRRLHRRAEPPAPPVRGETVRAQLAALAAWAAGNDSAYERLDAIRQPTLVANGAHDVITHAYLSYVMAQRLPDADLLLYADAGHGFLFQEAERFARDVLDFLDRDRAPKAPRRSHADAPGSTRAIRP